MRDAEVQPFAPATPPAVPEGSWLEAAAYAGYRLATRLGAPAARLYLRHRQHIGKEDEARFGERLGVSAVARPAGPLLWIHAVSVGEAMSILCLLDRLRSDWPALHILVTTTTVSSARALARRLPPGVIHQFVPADLPGGVERFLEHWRPQLVLFTESELWPNVLHAVSRREIPLVLVNGRMSRQSLSRRRLARPLFSHLLRRFALALAQSPDDAANLRALGAGEVRVTGNLKFSAPPLPADTQELVRLKTLIASRPLWLAASTHAGEEELVASVHERLAEAHPGLVTIVVPRHPERGAEIAVMVAGRGLPVARRGAGALPASGAGVYVADTLAELGLWYRLSDIVFMGGSLVPHGGQNPLEPARLGCAVMCGPHVWNFAGIVKEMRSGGAVRQVGDAGELAAAVDTFLANPKLRQEAEDAAARYVRHEVQVLDRVIGALTPFLDAAAAQRAA
jgi:3-deoxy-D-manno-octulosonic-acid transferase